MSLNEAKLKSLKDKHDAMEVPVAPVEEVPVSPEPSEKLVKTSEELPKK